MNRKCWISWYLSHLLAASASSMRVNESCLMLWMKLISSLGNQVVLLLMQIILFWLSLPCTYYKTVFWKTSSNSSYSLLILVKWTRPLVETTENPARLSATSVWRSTFHTSALKRTKIIQQKNSHLIFLRFLRFQLKISCVGLGGQGDQGFVSPSDSGHPGRVGIILLYLFRIGVSGFSVTSLLL